MSATNSKTYSGLDGQPIIDKTCWNQVRAMTDEEVTDAALADTDAQPLPESVQGKGRRLCELPGKTLLDKLRALKDENKQLLSVRYDADVVAFFKAKGKGYQKLMNNVLRDYMNREMQSHT